MKKILMQITIALLLIVSISFFLKVVALPNEQNTIDVQLEKCIEKDYSTSGMNKCVYAATDAWLDQISIYSNMIKKELSKEQYTVFIAAQQSWERYYELEKKLIVETVYNKEGSIHTNIAAGMLENIVKQRALYLKSYLYELKE